MVLKSPCPAYILGRRKVNSGRAVTEPEEETYSVPITERGKCRATIPSSVNMAL